MAVIIASFLIPALWFKHIAERFPQDLRDFRDEGMDNTNRWVIGGYWFTGLIALWWAISTLWAMVT